MSSVFSDRVDLKDCLSWNRQCPRGFMACFDFQTVTATMDATASFRHLRFAFCSMTSERTLSEGLVFVMVRAVFLIALLMSSVTLIKVLSSLLNLTGIVSGHVERIFPISKPFANVVKRWVA